MTISESEYVSWCHSSEKVRRGFGSICGPNLFWDPIHIDWTTVAMGGFDKSTNTKLDRRIFVADKGDYYEISDGLPQNQQ